ncbi:MAG TPA: 3-oxoadipate enol-lactonase [Burkholderiales bacterium]|jgi:3-oxoadipate enol-lactonase|nr:3-oxoadipate enol-lactonase [Burkholderiales bacterium]
MKASIDGIRINYEIEGSNGPWVTFSHSLACNLRMWDEQAAMLRDRYRVLRFDTRGHGDSDAPEGAYTLDQLAADLKGLLDALGIRETHFVGLSMGGMIGMTFALKYPGVFRTLVLCDTASRIAPEAQPVWDGRIKTAREQGMEPLVQPTLERWFTEPFRKLRPDVMKRVGDMIRSTPVAGYIGCCYAIPRIDLTGKLGAVRCPVLVVVGEHDVGTPPAMSEAIHDAIPGSELVVLKNASHLSNLEQSEEFNTVLDRFLGAH